MDSIVNDASYSVVESAQFRVQNPEYVDRSICQHIAYTIQRSKNSKDSAPELRMAVETFGSQRSQNTKVRVGSLVEWSFEIISTVIELSITPKLIKHTRFFHNQAA